MAIDRPATGVPAQVQSLAFASSPFATIGAENMARNSLPVQPLGDSEVGLVVTGKLEILRQLPPPLDPGSPVVGKA